MGKELPHNWVEYTLQDCFDVRDGTHDSPKYVDEGYPLITSKNIKNGELDYSKIKYINEVDYAEINKRSKVDVGDMLFSMIGTIGSYTVIKDEPLFAIKNVALFKPKMSIGAIFLSYYLRSPYVADKMTREAKGTTQKFVGLGYLRKFPFPVIPLPEQQRIVAKLDGLFAHLEEVKNRLEKVPQLLKDFRQSVLTQAVTGKLTEEWRNKNSIKEGERKTLDSIGFLLCGQSPKVSEVNTEGRGVSYVTGPEQWRNGVFVETKWTEYPRRETPENSIFITVKGAGVGKTFPGVACAIGRDVYAFVPSDNVAFRFVLFSIQATVGEVVLKAKGLIPGLSKSDIMDHFIYVPLIVEQTEIVSRVEALFSKVDAIEEKYTALKQKVDNLPQAILAKAFKGELVEQLPSDGDAKQLLKEIEALRAECKPKKRSKK